MEESWPQCWAASMVGGAIRSPSADSARDSGVLVLNLLWPTRGVTNTGRDSSALDKTFALIDGYCWRKTSRAALVRKHTAPDGGLAAADRIAG
jgi:hypothetical protein